MRWGTKAVATVVVALCLAPASAAAAAPANDDFANRQLLEGALPIEASGSNVEATSEAGEPTTTLEVGQSVWFEWVAPSTGWITVGACDADFAASVGIFTGTEPDQLTRVVSGAASEGPGCFNQRQLTFHAESGTHYVLRVDGQSLPSDGTPPPTSGSFTLRIEDTPPPPNDDFADAKPLEGSVSEEPDGARFFALSADGYNWGATSEPGEFTFGAEPVSSVWYRWTAPDRGRYRFTGPCCGLYLALFLGGSFDEEHAMVSGIGPTGAEVTLTAGTTVWIDVYGQVEGGSAEPTMGSFSFMVTAELPREANGPPPALACELANCRIAAPATVSPAPAPPDTTAPQTLLQRTLLRAGKRTAKFWFSASEPAVGFRCKLDKKGYKPCGSPRAYKHLRPGRHTFRAEAVDLAGNVDPSALVVHFRLARPSSRR